MVDAFGSDTFKTLSLTKQVNKVPYQPRRIGQMKIFEDEGVTQRTVVIEEQGGTLTLLPTVAWDSEASVGKVDKRIARPFLIPHTPHQDRVMASDVQGVRMLGSENEEETIAFKVAQKLSMMRSKHEITLEFRRAGAVAGKILDSNASTVIYDLFNEFSISETSENFDFAGSPDVIKSVTTVKRAIEAALGGLIYDHIHCLCSDGFWDLLIQDADIVAAYLRWREGKYFQEDNRFRGFEYHGVMFENYRGLSSPAFIASNTARFFPVGVPSLFRTYYAPANYMETVNTIGVPIYAKQEPMSMGKGMLLETQSNALPLCTIPGVLVKGTTT